MVHPLMILFGTINFNTLEHEDLLDFSFMCNSDITTMKAKIHEIGEKTYPYVLDFPSIKSSVINKNILENYDSTKGKIMYTEINNELVAFESQYINDNQIEILKETAILLTRIYRAYVFWNKNTSSFMNFKKDENVIDLSEDAILNKIENFPYSIYSIVYNILSSTKELPITLALKRVDNIRKKLIQYQGQTKIDKSPYFQEKLNILSDMSFWKSLIYSDYLRIYMKNPPKLTLKKMDQISSELKLFGISGFNPPCDIDQSFSNISRKASIDVDDRIIIFLEKIVRSGGINI